MVFIYPLEDGTNLNLYQSTSSGVATDGSSIPIQIDTLVLSVSGAAKDVPIAFGPLTADQYFFKLESNNRVNWELVAPDYSGVNEVSRFVASDRQTFLGTKFVFHADGVSRGEEIVIINPGTTTATVRIDKFNPATETSPAGFAEIATTTIAAGGFDEFSVNAAGLGKPAGKSLGTGRGHYKVTVTSGSPVLVWEGRWYGNNSAIGAAPDGSTIGSTIFVSAPNDEIIAGAGISDTAVMLRIVGVTSASYIIFSSLGPTSPFTEYRRGTVLAGAVASEEVPEDRLYKITTTGAAEKIQVQYGSQVPAHGAEMIGGNDGGVTTNPGTSFLFFFEGAHQKAIDVLIPQVGTRVSVTGPASTSLTSTLPDQVLHFLPATALPAGTTSEVGLYTVTATHPVWVVLTGELGDEQGYFVYTSGGPRGPVELSSSLGPINLRYCHSGGYGGVADCLKDENGQIVSTTGKVASQSLPETACAPGQPTTGTANVRVTAGDAITFAWADINCGTEAGTESFPVNPVTTAAVGNILQIKAEHAMSTLVRLRVVPRETEYDFIDNLTKGVKRIVVESLNDGKLLEKWAINGGERLVVQLKDDLPDVVTSAAVKFWVGHTRFFGPKTIIAKAYHDGSLVGEETRILSAHGRTTFSELQVYTPGNFGNNAFNKLEFSAAPGSWFGLGSASFNTARPVSP